MNWIVLFVRFRKIPVSKGFLMRCRFKNLDGSDGAEDVKKGAVLLPNQVDGTLNTIGLDNLEAPDYLQRESASQRAAPRFFL